MMFNRIEKLLLLTITIPVYRIRPRDNALKRVVITNKITNKTMLIIKLILILLLLYVTGGFIYHLLAMRRAMKGMIVGYKQGMYIDLKTNTFVFTKSPIYRDYKIGIEFLGKIIKID